ncbi:LysR family transcriptional regulator [Consotaella aegiceratis]|uniref:LysR family transcriptional regulator n=1 Tax=Consotaella aegiceratis TaxID=3097961 RepID=UPI002F3FEB60
MNLTLAAEVRNTTQSNLSKRLRKLEEYLGKELVDRSVRPLQLTPAGHGFLPSARLIIEELNGFREKRAPWHPAEGGVTIAMPHSATVSIFPDFKERLSQTLPGIFFAPTIANQDTVARILSRSEIDLALVTRHPAVAPADEFSVFRPVDIARDRLVIVAAPGTRENERRPLHISHPLTYLGKVWEACRCRVPICEEIAHGMASDIRAQCLAGRGRGVLPETLVEADIAAGRLVTHPCQTDLHYTISLYSAPRASRKAKQIWKAAAQFCTLY